MTFQDKLKRCAADVNKSQAGRAAGLQPTTISNYMAKGSIPRADIALKIARALDVPLDWLVDDSQGWPPPPSAPIAAISTEQLVSELGHRLSGVGALLRAKVLTAQMVDWYRVAMELMRTKPDAPLEERTAAAIQLPGQIQMLLSELKQFDPHATIGDALPTEISLMGLCMQCEALDSLPGFQQVLQLAQLRAVPKELRGREYKATTERLHKSVREQLDKVERTFQALQNPKTQPGEDEPWKRTVRRAISLEED